ncbi:MAG: 4-(cytidine 5'-diphospho)-2-C-methyl-D-erythritol kinase [bacterium]|jgi:4-diphosphocytidyl-2-C-methyl-D-erythritol kinase|nr:4-(cytidine 5'-diphospho)-2-C-methyl-D-erythritol kinase [candidate division KSB1 bacterium]MDH7559632.1 4-(cytidine 5'-diphospho)-2-C-methyl-D-erythritol kinase [bacterium]
MARVYLRSFAKINLGLRVLGRRSDGYHDICTIFQQVSLGDDIIVAPDGEEVTVVCRQPGVAPGRDNLCWRAAAALQMATGCRRGARITLRKRIPVGAGLGGGSSNAAVVLAALNEIWGTRLPEEELLSLAAQIGSDVPFFLLGGSAVGEGRGEVLRPIELPTDYWCVLAIPNVEISTRWAYSAAKFDLTKRRKSITFPCRVAELRDRQQWEQFLNNDFEEVVFAAYPVIAQLKAELRREGGFYCSLSGSGGAVFGLFTRREQARRARAALSRVSRAVLVRPVRYGRREVVEAVARQLCTA